MPTIAELRSARPRLADLSDDEIVDLVAQDYPDLSKADVAKALGATPPAEPTPTRTLLGTAGDVGISALKGAVSVPEAVVGLADMVSGGAAGRALEGIGFRPGEAQKILDTGFSPAQQAANQKVDAAQGIVDTTAAALQNPSVIAHSVIQSLPGMGLGGIIGRGALGAATRLSPKLAAQMAVAEAAPYVAGPLARAAAETAPHLAGALGEGVVMAGQDAEQIRQESADGSLTPTQALHAAAIGVTGGALSVLGGKVAKSLGISDIDTAIVAGRLNPDAGKGLVRRVLEGAVSEGILEELPQSVVEQVLLNSAQGKPLDEGVDHAAVLGALSGAAMGGGANIPGHKAHDANKKPADSSAPGADQSKPLALPSPTIEVAGDGTARTTEQRQARRQEAQDVPFREVKGPLSAAAAQAGTQGLAARDPAAVQDAVNVLTQDNAQQQAADAAGERDRQNRIETANAQAAQQDIPDPFADVPVLKPGVTLPQVTANTGDAAAPAPTVTPGTVDEGAHESHSSPLNDKSNTDAQILGGNATLGHTTVGGLGISIENADGSSRSDKENTPPKWTTPMQGVHYGYIKRTTAADSTPQKKQGIDVFLRAGTPTDYAGPVYVVDQIRQDGSNAFDEHKVMLGFNNRAAAVQAYKRHYSPGWKLGRITEMPFDQFKDWIKNGDTTKPASPKGPMEASNATGTQQEGAAPAPAQGEPQPATGAAADVPGAAAPAVEAAGTGREGYDTPVEVDARALKAMLEATRGEPLAEKPAKLEALRNGATPSGNIELAFRDRDGKLDVNDGRHRIALAAERGEKVSAFIDGKDAQRLREAMQAPDTNATTATAPSAQAPSAEAGKADNPEPVREPAETATAPRTVTVNDQTVTLTPEQAAAWDAADSEAESERQRVRATYERERQHAPTDNPDMGLRSAKDRHDAEMKRIGMELSAKRRRIAGVLTPKEQAADAAEAEKIKAGERVTVNGAHGTVTGNAFGKYKVQFDDGSTTVVPREQIARGNTPPKAEAAAEDTPEARWTRMSEADRRALVAQTKAKPKAIERVPAQAWADLSPGWQSTLAKLMKAAPAAKENTNEGAHAAPAPDAGHEPAGANDGTDVAGPAGAAGDVAAGNAPSPAPSAPQGRSDAAAPAQPAGSGPVAAAPAPTSKPQPSSDTMRAEADLNNALADLADFFGKPFRANIAPEQDAKLVPILTRVLDAAFRLGFHKFKDAAKFALDTIRSKLGGDVADALTLEHLQGAYIAMSGGKAGADKIGEVGKIQSKNELEAHTPAAKTEEPAPAPAPAAAPAQDQSAALVAHFVEQIQKGNIPEDNPALRRMVEAFTGRDVTPAEMKAAQEQFEAAIVQTARAVVAKGEGPRSTFDILLRIYQRQPNLNVRTSTSVENQAYSTPAPLAYLASRIADITGKTRVLEPTAGTGMLLMAANPNLARVNELNPERAALLEQQGFAVSTQDATNGVQRTGGKPVDAVITNPPFGSLKGDDGKTIKVPVDGYKLGQIDHLIAARALQDMKDDGQAVLILGANKVAGGQSEDDRIFFNWLYSHYHVHTHFEVDGKMYARQGASWPVRIIGIAGRKATPDKSLAPAVGSVERVDTWDQVYERYEQAVAARGQVERGAAPSAGGADQQQASGERAPRPVGSEAAGDGGRGPRGGTQGAGDVAGAGAGAVGDGRGGKPDGVGAEAGAQRGDAPPAAPDRLEAPGQPAEGGAGRRAGPADRGGNAGLAEVENQFQAKYVPRSARKDEGILIPVNMAQPLQEALDTLEDNVGDIDEFARSELGYGSVDEMHGALMGLQVDSVASAIYQIKERGKALIIADQTGIGKGRQAAAMIRWAVKSGKVPVFVTVKPALFTDMYVEDLRGIGADGMVTPFIMNVGEEVKDHDGSVLFSTSPAERTRAVKAMAGGEMPKGHNAVFMTYSQINVENAQRTAVAGIAPNAVFILDESHNAGGESATGEFIKGVLEQAQGTVYLSATYAKRPDNMPLYFKTDMGEAVADDNTLMDAMAAGGLPLQTVVANNLVKAGQMFRRERSYDGVEIRTTVATDRRAEHVKLSDAATTALRAIVAADKAFHGTFIKEMQEQIKAEGASVAGLAGNQAQRSVDHTQFSSVVHNFVRQMLLGLNAQAAADKAIEALKAGKKPLIALENTMGSFLNEYAANNSLRPGDPLGDFTYRTVLSRALERSRYYIEKDSKGEKTKVYVSLEELDPKTRAAYDHAQEIIDGLDIDIPVSPIDWMRQQLANAGHTVAEITGRDLRVDYTDPKKPRLEQVDQREQDDKTLTTRRFNGLMQPPLDAIILNVAGSTGISLHASEKFPDQRKRKMIVAQAAQDINIFMQMLGRIHRTGQVALPEYEILNPDLPATLRPTALLAKKMKSLNANTSSNTESATSVEAVDMLNKYGDEVVAQYLADNPELSQALGINAPTDEEGKAAEEDIARKATGRLALMPVAVQEQFYEEVGEQYRTLIDYLNRTNQNELEPRTFDFDAKELKAETIFQGQNPDSPFGQDATYGEYSVKAQGKALTPDEIKAQIKEHLGGKTEAEFFHALIHGHADDFKRFVSSLSDEQMRVNAENVRTRAMQFMQSHMIGSYFRVDINGDSYNAVVTNIRSTHKKGGNPYSLSKIQVTIAVNGALRSVTVPATKFQGIEVSTLSPNYRVDQIFKETRADDREVAKIITGNLLGAYGELQGTRGTIISFTKADGSVEQGILLPKQFHLADNTKGGYRLQSGADAVRFLHEADEPNLDKLGIATRDNVVRITPFGARGITLRVPKSKANGGKFFLDKGLRDILGDFYTRGNFMEATTTDGDAAARAIDHVMKKQAIYVLDSMKDTAQVMFAHSVKFDREGKPEIRQGGKPMDKPTFRQQGESESSLPADARRVSELQAAMDRITDAWERKVEAVVVPSVASPSVPREVRQEARKLIAAGGAVPSGVIYDGRMYLFADRIENEAQAAEVLFHEALGHMGLRGAFAGRLDAILRQIAAARPAEIAQIMRRNGFEPTERMRAAEELLAHMAETVPELGFVRRAVAAVRTFLRDMGFNLALSDDEIIRSYILPAREWVVGSKKAGAGEDSAAAPVFAQGSGRPEAIVRAGGRVYDELIEQFRMTARPDGSFLSQLRMPASALSKDARAMIGPELNLQLHDDDVLTLRHRDGADDRIHVSLAPAGRGATPIFNQGASSWEAWAPRAGAVVDGRTVRDDVPNLGSIRATLDDYDVLPGVRKVPMSAFNSKPSDMFYAANDVRRAERLADAIKESGELNPLIVVVGDKEGPYVLEGGHRLAALNILGATEFPAVVVVDKSSDVERPMFRQGDAGVNDPRDFFNAARGIVDELGANPGQQLNWWQKTFGTPYDLAQRHPKTFGRVYERVQQFLRDVSLFATEAADLAPRILPKLDSWRDTFKSPIKAEDAKSIQRPVFEGTLVWERDTNGKPVKAADLEERYKDLDVHRRAAMLVNAGQLTPEDLRRLQRLPIDTFESAINGRFEQQFTSPGIVWKDDELRSMFGLTDDQIGLYREARAAIDRSLTNLVLADMIRFAGKDARPIAETVMQTGDLQQGAEMLRDYLLSLEETGSARSAHLTDVAAKVMMKAERGRRLIDKGYAPLSRFGTHVVDVVDADGQRVYFGLSESRWDARRKAAEMRQMFPGATVRRGTTSQDEYKLFAGITPETAELFGEMLGLEADGTEAKDLAFQRFLKEAKSSRSAMKRLIERKGIAGFSEDVGRVLAAFIYSNARQTSSNLHTKEIGEAAQEIPQGQGELKDYAVRLMKYVTEPQEEAVGLRGMLFAQYLGGNIASMLVNMTQPFVVTAPYLTQYTKAARVGALMKGALADVWKESTGDAALDRELRLAAERGDVAPQEIHQLMRQAAGKATLTSGDGTAMGRARAMAGNLFSRAAHAWGQPFAVAELFNRRLTFIAAYRLAVEKGMANPAGFAVRAIHDTQFTYNKGNKPAWARGAVGGVLFTFKQYSVSYLELVHRMWSQGGPEGKKAALLMLAMLMAAGGAGGLPFEDDVSDLIDGIAQRLGYNFRTKHARQQFLADTFGKTLGGIIDNGVTGLPGMPIDVAGRFGMANLIPGTGLLLKKQDHTSDVTELAGPAGDLAKRIFQGANLVTEGRPVDAILNTAPTSIRNLQKAYDMATLGYYPDMGGKKVVDTSTGDVVSKALGFQPHDVAEVQDSVRDVQQMVSVARMKESEIANAMAQAIVKGDSEATQSARNDLARWNRDNPESPIRINQSQVLRRVREMRKTKAQRLESTAPKEMRAAVRRELIQGGGQ